MRTLSSALQTAYGAAVQRPAFLIEIAFASPVRVATYAEVSFNGNTFLASGVGVDGVRIDGSEIGGSIVLPNHDNTYGALVLTEGVTDRRIRIWGYDAGATATADFVELVDGVGGAARVDTKSVAINVRDAAAHVYAPRENIEVGSRFTYLLPAGKVLNINGQTYRLERK